MKVLLVRDGTVPRAVCEVLGEDDLPGFLTGQQEGDTLELFEVAGRPRVLCVLWWEDDGFEVHGEADELAGFEWLYDAPSYAPPIGKAERVAPGHWAISYGQDSTDPDGYGHVFIIG